ncbi:hypothetical protein MTO96_020419 [Rhipicephalus appendiculatus]
MILAETLVFFAYHVAEERDSLQHVEEEAAKTDDIAIWRGDRGKGAADAYDGASTHSTVASGWAYDVRLGERRWGLHHGTVYALPPAFRLAGSPFTGNAANAGFFVAVRRTTRGHFTYLPD